MRVQTPQQLIAPYFDLLNATFGKIADAVNSARLSSDAAATLALAEPRLRRAFLDEIAPGFMSRCLDFWAQNEAAIVQAAHHVPGLRATFGGDIGPQRAFRQLERAGLYFDTVLVQDPLLRVARMRGPVLANEKGRLLIKYALELIWSQQLYTSDVQPPVAVLIPDRELGGTRDQLKERLGETDSWHLLYWSTVLGRRFQTTQELLEYVNRLGTTDALFSSMERPELFRLDNEASAEPKAQWEAYLNHTQSRFDIPEGENLNVPDFVVSSVRGRLLMANDILNTAATYGGHPLIGAPTSYHYTAWRGTAIAGDVSSEVGHDLSGSLAQTNSLLAGGLDWLGNVSADELVALRRRGRLQEMRELLRTEAGKLTDASVDQVETLSRDIDHGLEQAFRRHKEEVGERDKEFRKDMATDTGSLLISAGLALQPMLVPAAPVWLAQLAGLVGASSTIKDIVSKVSDRIKETHRIAKSPIAILLTAKERENG